MTDSKTALEMLEPKSPKKILEELGAVASPMLFEGTFLVTPRKYAELMTAFYYAELRGFRRAIESAANICVKSYRGTNSQMIEEDIRALLKPEGAK